MSQQAPKFLLGGVNKWSNFFGLRTCQTAAYSVLEFGVKAAPIFVIAFGAHQAFTHYTPERDAFIEEAKAQPAEVRRAEF